jgi:hypothetical protein
MLFAIDIDQTICGSNAYEVFALFHNEDLDLQIDHSILARLTSYRDFFFLPEVVAFRRAHEKAWNASRKRAIETPSVIEALTPIRGAVEGITMLAQYGTIRYYTARTPAVLNATECWLAHYAFPESQHVVCCSSIEQKVRMLACHTPLNDPIVLIDDRGHTHFLAMLERFQEDPRIQTLLQRLHIIAFGTSPDLLPERTPCPLFALPTWEQDHLQALLPLVPLSFG